MAHHSLSHIYNTIILNAIKPIKLLYHRQMMNEGDQYFHETILKIETSGATDTIIRKSIAILIYVLKNVTYDFDIPSSVGSIQIHNKKTESGYSNPTITSVHALQGIKKILGF